MSFLFSLQSKDIDFESASVKIKSLNLASATSKNKITDYAFMEFVLTPNSPSSLKSLSFDPIELWFRTKNGRQVLVIDTNKMNTEEEPNRFKIREIQIHGGNANHVERIVGELKASGQDDLIVFKPISDDVETIVFEFKMPNKGKTAFDFFLLVEDTTTSETLECDPQVGNDPPK